MHGYIDRKFDALARAERRELLVALLDHNPQTLSESPSQPAKSDTAQPLVERDADRIERQHVHLPKLAEYGYVEWDREEDILTKGPRFDEIRPLVEFVRDNHE